MPAYGGKGGAEEGGQQNRGGAYVMNAEIADYKNSNYDRQYIFKMLSRCAETCDGEDASYRRSV